MSEHTKEPLQRYSTYSNEFDYCELREDSDGDYVLYADHVTELAALRERVKVLEEGIALYVAERHGGGMPCMGCKHSDECYMDEDNCEGFEPIASAAMGK